MVRGGPVPSQGGRHPARGPRRPAGLRRTVRRSRGGCIRQRRLVPARRSHGLNTRAALRATATRAVWVPMPWWPEMANPLRNAQCRRRNTAAKHAALAAAAAALCLQACREPVSLPTPDALAADHASSAQDACYPELALRRGLPLATLDQDLSAAMLRSGVPAAALHT